MAGGEPNQAKNDQQAQPPADQAPAEPPPAQLDPPSAVGSSNQVVPYVPSPQPEPPQTHQQQPPPFRRLKEWFSRTDHVLGRRLDDLRRLYGIDPMFTVLMSVFTLAAWMILNPKWAPTASHFICCCTYPLFESFAALRDRDQDALGIWCVYWFVYDWLETFDMLAELTLLYYPAKTLLAAYLFLPPTQYISIISDAWLMPAIELVYGELHIETLRHAHPMVLKAMGLTREQVRDWNQEQLRLYLCQCRKLLYVFLIRLHQLFGEVLQNAEPNPVVVEIPLD